MLRSKLENRTSSKIEVLEMEPAVVPHYRLAFNMRGFPPLEPGMGSLEPVNSTNRALYHYQEPECHGALVKLTPEDYLKVLASEGMNSTRPGYQEVAVTAIPYDQHKPPVQAWALQARPHVQLRRDPAPSARYMEILQQGAAELGLVSAYQEFLHKHPVQVVPEWLRWMAIRNLVGTFGLARLLRGWRGLSKLQSNVLFTIYSPSSSKLSNVLMGLILLPGAVLGMIALAILRVVKKDLPPQLKFFVKMTEKKPSTTTIP